MTVMINLVKNAFRSFRFLISGLRSKLLYFIVGDTIDLVVASDSRGNNYVISLVDKGVGRELLRNGTYHLHELEEIEQFLVSDSRVLIVGAHVGALAIPLSMQCNELHAIEANPDTFQLLELNKRLNDRSNLILHNFAANSTNEDIHFLKNTHNSGGSKRRPAVMKHMYKYDAPEMISVTGRRLDDEFDTPFDVILMDIEGSELFALQGMQNLLRCCKVLIVEFIPHHIDYVAGVSVDEFVDCFVKHFDRLYIPELNKNVVSSQFYSTLNTLYQENFSSQGLVFKKDPV
jgi:FkbM family methyltransferase